MSPNVQLAGYPSRGLSSLVYTITMELKRFEEYRPYRKELMPGVHVGTYVVQIDVISFAEETLGNVLDLFARKATGYRIDSKGCARHKPLHQTRINI